jgi:hypothetical protein
MGIIIVDDGEVSYSNPFGEQKTLELEALLRRSGCFVASFSGPDEYSAQTYILQRAHHGTETRFLFDRNIYSDVVGLAKGKTVTDNTRIPAAIMAFASCIYADIEPGLALYEGAASTKGGWKRDLALFHASDTIHPTNWAALALGRSQRFSRRIVRKRQLINGRNRFEPKAKLRSFAFNYPPLLKLAILTRRGGDRDARMIEFINWMYYSWQFSTPALLLAINVLGKKQAKGAFKGVGGSDRSKALRGVWNAAWDLAYVHEWFKSAKEQGENNLIHVLCSRDVLLLRVAGMLRQSMFSECDEEQIVDAGFSRSVWDLFRTRTLAANDTSRALVPWPVNFSRYRRDILASLRQEFLQA